MSDRKNTAVILMLSPSSELVLLSPRTELGRMKQDIKTDTQGQPHEPRE